MTYSKDNKMTRDRTFHDYITTTEAGELLGGVGSDTVRAWAKQGKIPKPLRTPGGQLRFERRQIVAFAEQLQTVRRGNIAEVLQRIIEDAGGIEACDDETIAYVQDIARRVGISR